MAYYLAVEENKKSYIGINVKRCRSSFGTSYRYDDPYACTLKEIDQITTTYKDEEELRTALTKIYSLSIEHIDKPLVIVFSEGIESRAVKGSILYENSRNLIENTTEVLKYIETKYRENDYNFFRQLAEQLRADSINKSVISQIATVIESKALNDNNEPTPIFDNSIITSAKLLIYENVINENGVVSPSKKINYESFHFIASFITDYEEKLQKDKTSGYSKTK